MRIGKGRWTSCMYLNLGLLYRFLIPLHGLPEQRQGRFCCGKETTFHRCRDFLEGVAGSAIDFQDLLIRSNTEVLDDPACQNPSLCQLEIITRFSCKDSEWMRCAFGIAGKKHKLKMIFGFPENNDHWGMPDAEGFSSSISKRRPQRAFQSCLNFSLSSGVIFSQRSNIF